MGQEITLHEPLWQTISQKGCIGDRRIHFFDMVDSTNTLALRFAQQGAEPGTVIMAGSQSQGRGRLGKAWQSPAGAGLYFSIIMRPRLAAEDLAKITLAAGLALCKGITMTSGIEPLLKWPNDLLVEQKKMAGILAEGRGAGNDGPLVIIGIGLNVNTPAWAFPDELAGKATSMRIAAGRFFDKGVVLTTLLDKIDLEVGRLQDGDFTGILNDWRAKDACAGKWLTWLTPAGQKVTGKSLGPDAEGLLHIRDAEGITHRVISGDLELAQQLPGLNLQP